MNAAPVYITIGADVLRHAPEGTTKICTCADASVATKVAKAMNDAARLQTAQTTAWISGEMLGVGLDEQIEEMIKDQLARQMGDFLMQSGAVERSERNDEIRGGVEYFARLQVIMPKVKS